MLCAFRLALTFFHLEEVPARDARHVEPLGITTYH